MKVEDIRKSVTSAEISRLSGSVMEVSSLIPRLSLSPGVVNPSTIFRFPSEMTFPLSIITLENVSVGRISPVSMTKGENTSSDLPSMLTVFFS